jgi:hypothetical protein
MIGDLAREVDRPFHINAGSVLRPDVLLTDCAVPPFRNGDHHALKVAIYCVVIRHIQSASLCNRVSTTYGQGIPKCLDAALPHFAGSMRPCGPASAGSLRKAADLRLDALALSLVRR